MAETTISRDRERAVAIPAPCAHRESRPDGAGSGPCEVCAEIARMLREGEVRF